MVDLLHHALCGCRAAGQADRHRHPVVLGHPGERCGHPSRAGVADQWPSGRSATPGCTPPRPRVTHPGRRPGAAGPPTAPKAPATSRNGPASRPADARSCPTPRCRWIGQFQPVPLGFHHPGGRDHRVRTLGRRAAVTPGADPGCGCCGSGLIRQRNPRLLEFVEQGAGPTGAGPRSSRR